MNRKDYYYDSEAPDPATIVPAVSAVILNKEEILLQERIDNGLWSLPGGQVDPGETVEQAIIREVKEETGLMIEVIRLIGVYSDPNHVIAYRDGEVRQQFSLCFLCKVINGSLVVSSESKKVGYVKLNDMETIHMHPSQKIRIRDAMKNQEKTFIR